MIRLPCVVWSPAYQGAGPPCLTHGRVCGVRGGDSAIAPELVLGSNPQTHPHTPIVLHWYTAGTGCESIDRVFLLEAALKVVLPLPLVV